MTRKKNVLLIVVDQWRGDTLPMLGHPVIETPNIAAIAAEGGAEALVDLIDPEHAGGHGLGQLDHLAAAGLTGPHQAGE